MVVRATVRLWEREIGAVVWNAERKLGIFEYTPAFVGSAIQICPVTMPLRAGPYDFPALARETFKGLPGLLSDSLPDKFGNLLINAWLAREGRLPDSMNPVERLCYTGTRGMGALEFQPSTLPRRTGTRAVDIEGMVELANLVLRNRGTLQGQLGGRNDEEDLSEILRIGTSAGGARAKAVLAWNEATGEFRSGQLAADPAYTYWLMKFDGVSGNGDKELADPQGFGRIEYACYLVATAAGVNMMRCRLHEEGGRAHFMTERFDRKPGGEKLHMLSLGGMCHYDFNLPRAYSYEQAIQTLRRIGAPREDIEQQVRRAFLNIVLRNQDDHVKNIAFLMDKRGRWRLSPAFDVCYAYNPTGEWTRQHQMSLNGKTDGFGMADLLSFAEYADIKPTRAREIHAEVRSAVLDWDQHAEKAGVDVLQARKIRGAFRLSLI